MNSTPSLFSYDHFDILPIEQINDIETKTQDVQNPDLPSTSTPIINSYAWTRCSKWEKLLPRGFIITEGNPTLLKLKVEIKTTDTAEKKSVSALVDCGQPIPVYNVDGTLNEAGSIMEVVNLILCYNNSERATFAVCGLGKQKLILGHSWLWKHNPEIDWVTQKVKMSRCPRCCPGCRDEVCQEHVAQKAEIQRMNACTAGSMPEISHDIDPSKEDAPGTTPESLSMEGDHIFATGLFPPGPCSKSFRSAPLCSNDGNITSDNRPHIETSRSAHFRCDDGVITSDNRLHIESS